VRARLALLTAAITAMVVVAFCLPLAGLIEVIATNQAVDTGKLESRSLAGALSAVRDPAAISQLVQQANAGTVDRVTVFLPTGRVLGAAAPLDASIALARQGRSFTAKGPGGSRNILVGVRGPDGQPTVVRVAVPRSALRRGVARAWTVLAALGVAMILIALAVADALARSLVKPIGELVAVTKRLQQGDLDTRFVPSGPREVVSVGEAVNELAGRISGLIAAEREAAADVSHQLRTPLTALRLDAESLQDDEERERLATGVDDLEAAVNRVIQEARRSTGPDSSDASADLGEAVQRRLAFWAVLAEDQHRPWSVDVPPGHCPVRARPGELDAVIDALLNNVFGHTPDGAGFFVKVERVSDGCAQLTVEDTGPGLPGDTLPVRGMSSDGGTGLGLDIARRTAEASGGSLQVGRSVVGGARIELRFGTSTR
jgi:signal transduction histidine kinase